MVSNTHVRDSKVSIKMKPILKVEAVINDFNLQSEKICLNKGEFARSSKFELKKKKCPLAAARLLIKSKRERERERDRIRVRNRYINGQTNAKMPFFNLVFMVCMHLLASCIVLYYVEFVVRNDHLASAV